MKFFQPFGVGFGHTPFAKFAIIIEAKFFMPLALKAFVKLIDAAIFHADRMLGKGSRYSEAPVFGNLFRQQHFHFMGLDEHQHQL